MEHGRVKQRKRKKRVKTKQKKKSKTKSAKVIHLGEKPHGKKNALKFARSR